MNRLQMPGRVGLIGLGLVLAACGVAAPQGTATPPTTTTPPITTAPAVTPGATRPPAHFPTALFASMGDEPVSDELAAKLQAVLEASANGDGLTATVIWPQGTWSGATGLAAGDRPMVPNDQMSIAHITQTVVAAQVMQLVEAGQLGLDDLAADRLPPGLEFDTNGATVENLLSMRSGISEYFDDEGEIPEVVLNDPLHVWTLGEKLATVNSERGPVGQAWDYRGIDYLLLGLIIEQVTGRSVGEVLRSGVLAGDGYERLIYQPDERPTDPIAMPSGAGTDTFRENGGYLPSLNKATLSTSEGAMASDAPSLARWLRNLCAGQVVSPASLDEMTDFDQRPEYGFGIWDRRWEWGYESGALGQPGSGGEGYLSAALCFQDAGLVVVVLANAEGHDVDTTAATLWRAATR